MPGLMKSAPTYPPTDTPIPPTSTLPPFFTNTHCPLSCPLTPPKPATWLTSWLRKMMAAFSAEPPAASDVDSRMGELLMPVRLLIWLNWKLRAMGQGMGAHRHHAYV